MSEHWTSLLGDKLHKSADSSPENTLALLENKKGVLLYFSAHWCPPCRGFTPKLADTYSSHLRDQGLEIVFVSSDRDEPGFKDYYKSMPWLSLPFADRDKKQQLGTKYGVQGIPALIVLDANGNVVTKDGRGEVSQDPTGKKLLQKLGGSTSTNGGGSTSVGGSSPKTNQAGEVIEPKSQEAAKDVLPSKKGGMCSTM